MKASLNVSKGAYRVQFQLLWVFVAGQERVAGQNLQHCHLGLQHGKSHSNAGSWTLAEPNEGVGTSQTSGLLGEVFRIELGRIGIELWVHVNATDWNVDEVVLLDWVLIVGYGGVLGAGSS